MEYDPSVLTAAAVTAEARAAQVVVSPAFTLDRYLPNRDNPSLSFNFDVSQTSLPQAASYRSFDAESDFGSEQGGESRSGRIPPISRKLRVNEWDTLSQQIDGTGLLEASYRKKARLIAGQIQTRVELARGQALEFGQVTLNENRLKATIDFGRKAAHAVTAVKFWSDPTADVLGDLAAWKAVYVAANNGGWGDVLISTQVMTALQRNDGIRSAATGRPAADVGPIISVDQVQAVFSAFGYGTLVINDEKVAGAAGAQVSVISPSKVIFVPSSASVSISGDGGTALGGTDWGITAESLSPKYGIGGTERSGIFGAVFSDNDPEGRYVLLSATALPILENANATLAAKVLA
ncbi:major capsid protein [Curtobacterium sp. Curtsp57]|uniref:major capsid protein n=1 Tax=Curtobacterium sp. Curtsp57 TaxID=3243047 RepID=UPI0039B4666D